MEKWANKLTVQNLKRNVSKQVYPVCYSCCLGVTSCCLLVVKTKVNGMTATQVKGMASMRVTAKRAKWSPVSARLGITGLYLFSQDIFTRGYFLCHAQTRETMLRVNM